MKSINIPNSFDRITEYWSPQIAGRVNNAEVRLAKIKGEFDWHKHDEEDEAFFVVRGALSMRLRDRTVEMAEGDFFVVPRGVEHQPVADEECWIMMIEQIGALNTGDRITDKTKHDLPRLDT